MSDKAKVGGTMMILYKLLDREIITEINGCISTGTEANVYHCTGGGGDDTGQSKALVKIFKTNVLVFKDGDKSVRRSLRIGKIQVKLLKLGV